MESFNALFAELIDREAADLTADERESLIYYYASLNLAERMPVDTEPRRWCDMATTVARISYMLSRVPRLGDPGTSPQIVQWIRDQESASLNSYQRARLSPMPGGAERFR